MANIYDMSDTWNALGTTFTAIKMDVDDQASASGSLLMDLQVGGTSKFSVSKAGVPVIPQSSAYAFAVSGAYSVGLYSLANYTASISMASGSPGGNPSAYKGFEFELTGPTLSMGLSTLDVKLTRDAANTLAQRNGTNAQTFNLYNTYTDASNYERGFMKWNANVLRIGTEAAGTGTVRSVQLGNGNSFVSVSTSPTGRTDVYTGQFVIYTTGGAERLRTDDVGSVRISTGLTVATLPGTPLAGMMARVTDASAPAVGLTVAGGGAANALCWYNGTNWTVIGV